MKQNPFIDKDTTIKETPFPCIVVKQDGGIIDYNQPFAELFFKTKWNNIFDGFFAAEEKNNEKNRIQKLLNTLKNDDCWEKIRLMINKKACVLPLNNNSLNIISLLIDVQKTNSDHFIFVCRTLGGIKTTEIAAQINAQKSSNNDFSAILAHEVRTPLNAILNISQHLFTTEQEENNSHEELLEGLGMVVQNSQRLNLFLENLSEFIALESKKKLIEESFQIKDILPKCQRLFHSLSHEKNLSLEIFSQNIENDILIGDRLRLYQIFVIVTLFITKTFTNGKSTISFEKKLDKKKLENTLWCVIDISLQNVPTKNEFYINFLERNIKMIGGQKVVKYGEKNVTITFDIPFFIHEIEKKNENAKPIKQEKKIQAKEENFQPNSKKGGLLIIDDEPVGSKILDMMLKKEQITIYKALNGQEALQQMKEHHQKIKLVLMDLMLPDTTGYELLQKFKEDHPSLPIIAFSALNEKNEIRKMIELGFFDYIPKPFTERDLENILELIQ